MSKIYVTIYTKEHGKQELTYEEWNRFAISISTTWHRIDGPAWEFANGDRAWYIEGKRHRVDGPAAEYSSGSTYWQLEGKYFTEKEFNKLIQEVRDMLPVLRLTDPRKWVREYRGHC